MHSRMGTGKSMFTITNDGQRDVQFNGEHIGRASSERVAVDRWTEINIYRTVQGSKIVQVRGCSRVEGETNRSVVHVCATDRDVIAVLTRDGNLSRLARQVLDLVGVDFSTFVH